MAISPWKRGMEVSNFVTFPYSTLTFRKSKKLGWYQGVGIIRSPRTQATSRRPALLGFISIQGKNYFWNLHFYVLRWTFFDCSLWNFSDLYPAPCCQKKTSGIWWMITNRATLINIMPDHYEKFWFDMDPCTNLDWRSLEEAYWYWCHCPMASDGNGLLR